MGSPERYVQHADRSLSAPSMWSVQYGRGRGKDFPGQSCSGAFGRERTFPNIPRRSRTRPFRNPFESLWISDRQAICFVRTLWHLHSRNPAKCVETADSSPGAPGIWITRDGSGRGTDNARNSCLSGVGLARAVSHACDHFRTPPSRDPFHLIWISDRRANCAD